MAVCLLIGMVHEARLGVGERGVSNLASMLVEQIQQSGILQELPHLLRSTATGLDPVLRAAAAAASSASTQGTSSSTSTNPQNSNGSSNSNDGSSANGAGGQGSLPQSNASTSRRTSGSTAGHGSYKKSKRGSNSASTASGSRNSVSQAELELETYLETLACNVLILVSSMRPIWRAFLHSTTEGADVLLPTARLSVAAIRHLSTSPHFAALRGGPAAIAPPKPGSLGLCTETMEHAVQLACISTHIAARQPHLPGSTETASSSGGSAQSIPTPIYLNSHYMQQFALSMALCMTADWAQWHGGGRRSSSSNSGGNGCSARQCWQQEEGIFCCWRCRTAWQCLKAVRTFQNSFQAGRTAPCSLHVPYAAPWVQQ